MQPQPMSAQAPYSTVPIAPHVAAWFKARGWEIRQHQQAMLAAAEAGQHALLVAATGAGKTLAGFLPTLCAFAAGEMQSGVLHTIYVSPLKALAVDVARNLDIPAREMGLDIDIETRTGDTPAAKKRRQRLKPPHILLTTPESLALMLSYPESFTLFANLKTIIIDEIHAFATTKRGDQLVLALARLQRICPQLRRVALSATIADTDLYRAWLAPSGDGRVVTLVLGEAGAVPEITIAVPTQRIPWTGHAARHSLPLVYQLIQQHRTTLIFVNTRGLAELIFRDLWLINDDNLAIGMHHGSLSAEERRKIEAAMAAGKMRAIIATSSLDLGIDWGDVDLVIQMGAPKGASRLLQRLGRSNHRLDEPSKAILIPGNRFEYLEAMAARDAVLAGELDPEDFKPGAIDVLAQHVMGIACAGPLWLDTLHQEIISATPYASLAVQDVHQVMDYLATGGYALRVYDQYARLRQNPDGSWSPSHPGFAKKYRLNAGTIVDAPQLTVKLGSLRLGQVEEWFGTQLRQGDSFLFAGRNLEFIAMRDTMLMTRLARSKVARFPSYVGARMPLSTHLAERVRAYLSTPELWSRFPDDVREWLTLQQKLSILPKTDELLIETFYRKGKYYCVAYCFEGRPAHHALGLLITERMERNTLKPLGFVATDYVVAIWGLSAIVDPAALFSPDILEEELRTWITESSMLKRAFRDVAIISGLVERKLPGIQKSSRQMLASTDIIYDVLQKYEPEHLLLKATWDDVRHKIADIARLDAFLQRVQGKILFKQLESISPLAIPVILEIGRETVSGEAVDLLIAEGDKLLMEAMQKSK